MPALVINGVSVPCRGVLFDKDGTLLHFMALWGSWAEYVLRYMEERLEMMGGGFTGSRERLLGTLHGAEGQVNGYDAKGPLAMGTEEETIGLLAWQLYAAGMPWNEALLQVSQITKNAMFELRKRKPAYPMPGLDRFLKECREAFLGMAVVTSDTTEAAAEHLDWLGITSFFTEIIGRDRVLNGKPHPDMVEAACLRLGIRPDEAVVIGDSNGDMQMAKQAGAAAAVGLRKEDGTAEHLVDADMVIHDYNDIKVAK